MPTLFSRFSKKSTKTDSTDQPWIQYSQGLAPRNNWVEPVTDLAHVDQRIHPDLNSLVGDTAHVQEFTGTLGVLSEFVPLHPSPRKQSNDGVPMSNAVRDKIGTTRATSSSPSANIISEFSSTPTPLPIDSDVSKMSTKERESSSSVGLNRNISPHSLEEEWPTFGRTRKGLSEFGEPVDTCSITPATPKSTFGSEVSQTRNDTSTSTLDSRSRSSAHGHGRYTSTSSPHTFGIPTPPSSGFTFSSQRRFRSSETPPPLPPLDHPAFYIGPTVRPGDATRAKLVLSKSLGRRSKTFRQQRPPRHTASLPSFSRRAGHSTTSVGIPPNRSRQRAMTESRTRVTEIFSDRSTPNQNKTDRNNRRHGRSQSRGSNNSRRYSAEFSAMQASSVGHENEIAGSWEAQVSREILRKSLVRQREMPEFKVVAGGTELGPTRGNSLVRSNVLGSPFLLQDAHTHNIPGLIPDDHTRIGSNLVVTEHSQGGSNILVMKKDDSSKVSEVTKDPTSSKSRREKSSTPQRTPSPPLSRLNTIPYPEPEAPTTSFLMPPPSLSFTAPTPLASPISPVQAEQHQKSPTDPLVSVLRVPQTPPVARTASGSSHRGKRKADEAEVGGGATPPKEQKEPRATFAVGPRPHRESATSGSSRAPSSYHRKRARLSTTPEARPASRTSGDHHNAATTGSWSSRGSGHPAPPRPPPAIHHPEHQLQRTSSRRSLSQTSIPISALISPHAPSISRSTTFHMRDPRKPAPVQSTPWSLAFPSSGHGAWVERGGSPLHAWLFFVGFIIFPLWWIAAFLGTPKTRRLGGTDAEKTVLLDDPQVESDAKSWRKRCRVMAAVSFLTYIPFVVLVAIFAR